MTTTDTREALDAAIRTFGLGAYSPGEPAAPDSLAATHIWIEIEAYGHAAPLRAAITAHVEAEVARRLAAAPGVEEAIQNLAACEFGAGFRRRAAEEHDPDDRDALLAAIPTLRAAIAADRERAVSEALSGKIRNSPTPDEARRLVDAHGDSIRRTERAAAGVYGDRGDPVTEQMVTAQIDARNALLRALGVEA